MTRILMKALVGATAALMLGGAVQASEVSISISSDRGSYRPSNITVATTAMASAGTSVRRATTATIMATAITVGLWSRGAIGMDTMTAA